jgi:hypothetical protein
VACRPGESKTNVRNRAAPLLVAAVTLLSLPSGATAATETPRTGAPIVLPSALGANATWLETLNSYRAASGLDPVIDEPAWSDGIAKHLRYLAETPRQYRGGPFASEHTENPASPLFTPEGAAAGLASNLGYGWTERDAIENFLTAPFHAIGMLRPGLRRSAFGALDVNVGVDTVRGLVDDRSVNPVLFPGDGSATSLTTYTGNENPNPLESCPGYRVPSGLPLIALLPTAPSPYLTAALTRSGRSLEVCTITAATLSSSDPIWGATARITMARDNAVIIVPREPLTIGSHAVRLSQPGRPDITWSFTVEPPPDTRDGRVLPGYPLRLRVATPGNTVTGTVTIDAPLHPGYATVYPCATGVPATSNVNFDRGQAVASAFLVEADSNGDICVNVSKPTHVIVDVISTGDRPQTSVPVRTVDTRTDAPLPAGAPVRFRVGTTANATVIGTITMTEPSGDGHVSIGPCDGRLGETSAVNVRAGQTVANMFVAQVDASGDLCVRSSVSTDVVIDRSVDTADIIASPKRVLDTRTGRVAEAGEAVRVAIPGSGSGPTTLFGNLTVVDPEESGYVVAYDCARTKPETSNANFRAGRTIATAFVVGLTAGRELCVTSSVRAHILVDQSATSNVFGTLPPAVRAIDTRRQAHTFVLR